MLAPPCFRFSSMFWKGGGAECKDGWYGENCGEVCGHCLRGNTTCDNKIGYCPSCGGAFQPPLCKEKCSAGYYGQNCKQTCGHCRVNTTCDPDNGTCTYGCSGGYKEGLCSECEDGWYGDDCTETCGHCMGGSSTCDKKYGSCSSCDGAFQPPLCKETCQDGWYGKNCLERCGHCVGGNSTCDKTSGSCPSCDGSFQLPLCKESVMPSSNDKETVSLVGPVAGAAAGCSVIFFIIGGLFVCCIFRKTRSRHSAGAVRSPDEISMTFGSSMATPRSENTPDITSPENISDPSVNVYDKLHARANDNTAAYSSITLHTDSKDTTTATEYVNITSTANDKNRYKRNQGKVVRQ
ncbi:hypothetical protein C0Q70_15148 [Pomacea canaliculata]|uniref:EGF-like domain-containing protein n=1 Tax=Pomacea canaliculata TaxID=400727 RepID=A0A2T7NU28_POMCA|nr:hypothetical protein C0Q70_15148 [Pomacea canaliculata]